VDSCFPWRFLIPQSTVSLHFGVSPPIRVDLRTRRFRSGDPYILLPTDPLWRRPFFGPNTKYGSRRVPPSSETDSPLANQPPGPIKSAAAFTSLLPTARCVIRTAFRPPHPPPPHDCVARIQPGFSGPARPPRPLGDNFGQSSPFSCELPCCLSLFRISSFAPPIRSDLFVPFSSLFLFLLWARRRYPPRGDLPSSPQSYQHSLPSCA